MTAVEFSPQERARLAAIEAAEPAPESWHVQKAVADELRAMGDVLAKAHEQGPARRCRNRANKLDPR